MSKAKGIKRSRVRGHPAGRRCGPCARRTGQAHGADVVVRLRGRRPGRGREGIAYVGNMRNPHGTIDHRREGPEAPEAARRVEMPPGTHSHKVRVKDGIMVTNREILGRAALRGRSAAGRASTAGSASTTCPIRRSRSTSRTGRPTTSPARATRAACTASISTAATPTSRRRCDGYVGNIVMILDLKDPGEAGGSRPLVDAGPVDRGRRDADVERRPRIAATIRCATATGSTRATGTAAS